jgi:hypothetical protein
MSDRKSDQRVPITNRSLTENEHEEKKQYDDEQQHVRSASNPGNFTFCITYELTRN